MRQVDGFSPIDVNIVHHAWIRYLRRKVELYRRQKPLSRGSARQTCLSSHSHCILGVVERPTGVEGRFQVAQRLLVETRARGCTTLNVAHPLVVVSRARYVFALGARKNIALYSLEYSVKLIGARQPWSRSGHGLCRDGLRLGKYVDNSAQLWPRAVRNYRHPGAQWAPGP